VRKTLVASLCLVFAFGAAAASAEDLQAEGALLCALASAAECDEAAQCDAVTLEQIGVPDRVRIDFAGKQLVSADGARTSPIAAVEVQDTVLLLQGHQNGRGWTLVIERSKGHLVGTLADAEGSFALAGGCRAE
jgi:hypothetical protein